MERLSETFCEALLIETVSKFVGKRNLDSHEMACHLFGKSGEDFLGRVVRHAQADVDFVHGP